MSEETWPDWWEWELILSPHLLKRMADRGFSEVELREMLEHASKVRADIVPGRWRIGTRHKHRPWEVIVEPDDVARVLVVVTAYPVARSVR